MCNLTVLYTNQNIALHNIINAWWIADDHSQAYGYFTGYDKQKP